MSAGRRGPFLSAAFFGLTLCLCSSARAQPPFRPQPPDPDPQAGRHDIWTRTLSPDQIRELLTRFGQGDKDAAKQFENLIRDRVKKSNPKANENKEQIDAAIKRMMADKEFMDWAMDQAQKHKNQNPGERFEITPEMLDNLKNRRPGDDPFKLPKTDTKPRPPVGPDNPPKVNPRDPPRIDPPPPRVGDPPPPAIDPKTGLPADPPDRKRKFDPNNPLGAPTESPDKAAKTKAAETATALWEKNVGPIDESPAVRRAILDLVSDPEAMDALTDGKGNSIFDSFGDAGDGDGFKDLFGDGKGWEWPKLDWNMNWGRNYRNIDIPDGPSRNRWPDRSTPDRRGGSSIGGMGSFDLGGMRVPWLLALVVLAAILAAVLWWKWAAIFPPGARGTALAGGPGEWPIDPRAISTREDIVKAFEYLSVLICGPGARTWTHSTIADELTALAATHGETAMKLARLYELARYAPLDEPPTRVEIVEARRLVCDLAGVDEA